LLAVVDTIEAQHTLGEEALRAGIAYVPSHNSTTKPTRFM
jgi:hypothetical protein